MIAATVTITDDESAPTVSLSTDVSSIDENSGSNITLTATLVEQQIQQSQ